MATGSRKQGLQELHSFAVSILFLSETLCGGHCAQTGEDMFLSVIESQKRADAWERIWRSDGGNGLSQYRRWSEWLRQNTRESISRLTDTSSRTPRTSERSSRRAPATVSPIQVPNVRSSQGAGKGIQRGSERAERAADGTTLHDCVCSVRQWPGDGESGIDKAGRGRGGVW